jgi:ligand-binding sensor domain-containing protein
MSAPDVGALNNRDGLAEDNISTTYCDQRGGLWFTTVTGRVFQYVNGRVEPVHLPPPADLLRIRATFEDHTGAFWFGTDNQGAVRFVNGKSHAFYRGRRTAQQRHSSVLRRSKPQSVDRYNQRTQPLGRLTL